MTTLEQKREIDDAMIVYEELIRAYRVALERMGKGPLPPELDELRRKMQACVDHRDA